MHLHRPMYMACRADEEHAADAVHEQAHFAVERKGKDIADKDGNVPINLSILTNSMARVFGS